MPCRWGFLALMTLACLIFIPFSACAGEDMITFSGDIRWSSDDKITAVGVEAVYRDFKVTADSAEADLNTNIAVFKGNVELTTQKHTVDGDSLVMNLKTKEWTLENASSRMSSEVIEGAGTFGPVYLASESVGGNEEEFKLHTGTLTTCDLDHPHYYFSARELEVHPESKIVARRVSMVGLDKRFFTLNTLVIPIRGFRHNFIPQVGSSAEEGMFLKAAYSYMATKESQGFLKLDLMQKRGVGTGLEHAYKTSAMSTQASLYYLADQEIGGSNITGRLQHQQKLGNIHLNLTGDYRTNNYLYYPSSTNQNWQAALTHASTKGNTALTFRSNASRSFSTSETFTSSLRHTQQFNQKLSGLLSMDMRKYDSTSINAADRELDAVMEFRQRDEKYDLSLIASKRFDLDGDDYLGDQYYSSLDRLPELTFSTDSYRLGTGAFLGLPSRFSLMAGRYHEMPSAVTSDRVVLQWDMLGHALDIGSKSDLNLTGGFRQAYYASDSMQHVLKGGGVFTTRYNDYLKTRLTYNYQDARGFSPFRFDYTGKYNYARMLMEYQDSKVLRWSLSSGYDFKRGSLPWQDLAFRLTANPSAKYAFSVATGYDLNRSIWRSLTTQFRVNNPDRLGLDIGARYELATGKLGLARGRIDYRLNDKWRIEGITSWNGFAKQFDYQAFRLTRDLHCWEVSLTYNDETGFRNDKGFSLDFRIKAFPKEDRFGIGQYGQAVDTGMGQYFY